MLTRLCSLVAVTGLGGHAFGSWKVGGKHDMWLRDYLPEDLRKQKLQTRIMIYGYNSKLVESRAHATLHDYATQFLEALKSARSTDIARTLRIFQILTASNINFF